jgi:hypothetical protein
MDELIKQDVFLKRNANIPMRTNDTDVNTNELIGKFVLFVLFVSLISIRILALYLK